MLTEQQKIIDGIYAFLNASIGSENPSGQMASVYEIQAPQDTELPICIFNIITDTVESGMNCDVSEIDLQIDFYGNRKDGSKKLRTIADTLFNDFNRNNLTIDDSSVSNKVNGVVKGLLTSEDTDIFRIKQEYIIRVQ